MVTRTRKGKVGDFLNVDFSDSCLMLWAQHGQATVPEIQHSNWIIAVTSISLGRKKEFPATEASLKHASLLQHAFLSICFVANKNLRAT